MTPVETDAGVTWDELGIEIPRGARGPNVKTHCPRCHGERKNQSDKSLSINLDSGEIHCHHCGWASGLGVEARALGRSPAAYPGTPPPARSAPPLPRTLDVDAETMLTMRHEWAVDWLAGRGIDVETAAEFSLGSVERKRKDGTLANVITFPYYLDGGLVNIKHRILPKEFRQEPDAPKVLYNIDRLAETSVPVIVEGELDVLACHIAGWHACSPQDGAPAEKRNAEGECVGTAEVGNKDAGFDEPTAAAIFARATRIIIATDDDPGGRKLADHLIQKFGAVRCYRVAWSEYGVKDANDLLMRDGPAAVDRALERAKPVPLPGVRSLAEHRHALYTLSDDGFSPGVGTGWVELDHLWRPVPGELVVATGYPGHGKTSLLNNLFTNLAQYNGWNIGLYSPEMGDEGEVLGKFVQIANDAPYLPGAVNRMSREAMDVAIEWVGERFWEIHGDGITDDDGFAALTVPQILEQAQPLVTRRNLNLLVIDPWNQCESARPRHMTVEEYIASSVGTIRRWARRNRVVTVIVIHPRKPDSISSAEEKPPHPYEAAGAAHWYNMADVFLSIHRVKTGPDAGVTTVAVKKHRKEGVSGNLGEVLFRFDRRSGRFYCEGTPIPERPGANPYPNLPAEYRLSPAPVRATPTIEWDGEEGLL